MEVAKSAAVVGYGKPENHEPMRKGGRK